MLRERRRAARLRVLIALASLAAVSLPLAAHATSPINYADKVGYVSAAAGNYAWELHCTAVNSAGFNELLAVGTTYNSGFMSHIMSSSLGYASKEGHYVAVGGNEIVWQGRRETHNPALTSLDAYGSASTGPGSLRAYVAFALWGEASCSTSIDGSELPIQWVAGTYGFYAGPEAFTGGVLYQNGGSQMSLGRVFEHVLAGGPVFAHMFVGEQLTEGGLAVDSPSPWMFAECREPQGGTCEIGSPTAHRLVAGLGAAVTLGTTKQAQGELYVLSLPPA